MSGIRSGASLPLPSPYYLTFAAGGRPSSLHTPTAPLAAVIRTLESKALLHLLEHKAADATAGNEKTDNQETEIIEAATLQSVTVEATFSASSSLDPPPDALDSIAPVTMVGDLVVVDDGVAETLFEQLSTAVDGQSKNTESEVPPEQQSFLDKPTNSATDSDEERDKDRTAISNHIDKSSINSIEGVNSPKRLKVSRHPNIPTTTTSASNTDNSNKQDNNNHSNGAGKEEKEDRTTTSNNTSPSSASSATPTAATATTSGSSLPIYHSVSSYGQDAWFVHSSPFSALHCFGVADGVGGWRSQGVDSGLIAREMMKKCMELAEKQESVFNKQLLQLQQPHKQTSYTNNNHHHNNNNNSSSNSNTSIRNSTNPSDVHTPLDSSTSSHVSTDSESTAPSSTASSSSNTPAESPSVISSPLLSAITSTSSTAASSPASQPFHQSKPVFYPYSIPAQLMQKAYRQIKQEAVVTAGSTTACVLTITTQPCHSVHPPQHSPFSEERADSSASSSPLSTSISHLAAAVVSPPPSPFSPTEVSHQLSLDDEESQQQRQRGRSFLSEADSKETSMSDDVTAAPTTEASGSSSSTDITQPVTPTAANSDSMEDDPSLVPATADADIPLSASSADSDDDEEEQMQTSQTSSATTERSASSVNSTISTVSSTSLLSSSSLSSSFSAASSNAYKSAAAFWDAAAAAAAKVVASARSPLRSSKPSSMNNNRSPSDLLSPLPSPSASYLPLYLSCASLGDSGFFLIRHGRVIHRSELQRTGRIVKQLAIIPPHLSGPEHCYCDDSPDEATLTSHRLQAGDLVICGSDGLLDNLVIPHISNAFFSPWGRFLFSNQQEDREAEKQVEEKMNRKIEQIVKECMIDVEWTDMNNNTTTTPTTTTTITTPTPDTTTTTAATTSNGPATEESTSMKQEDEQQQMSATSSMNVSTSPTTTAAAAVAAVSPGVADHFKHSERLVQKICDRLVAEASEFMNCSAGKPDDLCILVLQINAAPDALAAAVAKNTENK